jgi:hypothetical protein
VYVRHHRARRELGEVQLNAVRMHRHAVTAKDHHRLGQLLDGEQIDELGRSGHCDTLPRHHGLHNHVQLAVHQPRLLVAYAAAQQIHVQI